MWLMILIVCRAGGADCALAEDRLPTAAACWSEINRDVGDMPLDELVSVEDCHRDWGTAWLAPLPGRKPVVP